MFRQPEDNIAAALRPLLGSLRRGGGTPESHVYIAVGPLAPRLVCALPRKWGRKHPKPHSWCGFPGETPEKASCSHWYVYLGLGWAFPQNGSSGVPGKSPEPQLAVPKVNAFSRREESIGAPHARDFPGGSRGTFYPARKIWRAIYIAGLPPARAWSG